MVEYFTLSFNHEGRSPGSTEEDAIIEKLVHANPPVTDLWILAYGWNNDEVSGKDTYGNTWIPLLWSEIQKMNVPDYNPLFVGVFWPSKAWTGDIEKPVASRPITIDGVTNNGDRSEQFAVTGVAATTSGLADEPEGKKRFITDYRLIMDPEGHHGSDYDRDFAYLYDLMYRLQRPDKVEIEKFVTILKRYEIDDPHSDPIEKDNVVSAPVDTIVDRLKDEQTVQPERYVWSVEQQDAPPPIFGEYRDEQDASPQQFEGTIISGSLLTLFRTFSFWTMKARAAIVGENGVYPVLVKVKKALKQHNLPVRIHLLGHSFGAKLVTAAVYGAAEATDVELPLVNTLVLLMGAFSQFSFSNNIPIEAEAVGRYTPVVERGLVANPVVAIYSQYDTANKVFYPLGMLPVFNSSQLFEQGLPVLSDMELQGYQVSNDRFGSIGANGAQGLSELHYHAIDMLPLSETYNWSNLKEVYCINVDGQRFIQHGGPPVGAHNDYNHAEIFHLALAISLR